MSRVLSCQLSNNNLKKVNAPQRECTYGPYGLCRSHEDCRITELNINYEKETCKSGFLWFKLVMNFAAVKNVDFEGKKTGFTLQKTGFAPEKTGFAAEESPFDRKKRDLLTTIQQSNFSRKIKEKMSVLLADLKENQVISARDIMRIPDCKSTAATEMILRMTSLNILKKIEGLGHGKYSL